MKRYYLGVDWGDRLHQVYVGDDEGKTVREMKVQENPQGLTEIGRWLDEKRAEGCELWAAIEKPAGRMVDFLLDHGVEVYPVNPKAVDRVRDRYRMSDSKCCDQALSKPKSLKCLVEISAEWCAIKRACSISSLPHSKSIMPVPWRPLRTWRLRLPWIFSDSIRPRLISVHLNVKSSIALPPSNII